MYETMSEALRSVRIAPYIEGMPTFKLELFDCGPAFRRDAGKNILGYRLTEERNGVETVIFEHATRETGASYVPGFGTVIDSDKCLTGLLGFLSCRPGDTDADFFERYTKEQLEFAREHGETLAMIQIEAEEGNVVWENLDGWEASE